MKINSSDNQSAIESQTVKMKFLVFEIILFVLVLNRSCEGKPQVRARATVEDDDEEFENNFDENFDVNQNSEEGNKVEPYESVNVIKTRFGQERQRSKAKEGDEFQGDIILNADQRGEILSQNGETQS